MNEVMWNIKNLKVIPLAWQIGWRNGLKTGDRLRYEELFEVWNRHPDWLEPIGVGDPDLLTGNLREKGLKVLNLRELKRKQNNDV